MNTVALENLVNFLISFSVWSIFKVLICLAFLMYIVFALVVVKQVTLMTQTLGGQLELPLKMIAAIHLAGAILVFVLAIFVL